MYVVLLPYGNLTYLKFKVCTNVRTAICTQTIQCTMVQQDYDWSSVGITVTGSPLYALVTQQLSEKVTCLYQYQPGAVHKLLHQDNDKNQHKIRRFSFNYKKKHIIKNFVKNNNP